MNYTWETIIKHFVRNSKYLKCHVINQIMRLYTEVVAMSLKKKNYLLSSECLIDPLRQYTTLVDIHSPVRVSVLVRHQMVQNISNKVWNEIEKKNIHTHNVIISLCLCWETWFSVFCPIFKPLIRHPFYLKTIYV